jgi:hypothetical protein
MLDTELNFARIWSRLRRATPVFPPSIPCKCWLWVRFGGNLSTAKNAHKEFEIALKPLLVLSIR